jgi:uncharacterized protein YkwD
MTNQGLGGKPYGAEVIAANRWDAKSYADAWWASPVHQQYVGGGEFSGFGVGVYGKWAVGYVN